MHPTIEIFDDIFIKISEFLSDKDKIRLTTTSTKMNKLKFVFTYVDKIKINLICNLPYYDNFQNISTNYCDTGKFLHPWDPLLLSWAIAGNNLLHLLNKGKVPNKMKYHHFTTNVIDIAACDLKLQHHESLFFDETKYDLYVPLKNMSYNITHLTISKLHDEILDYIPNTVTHLFFGEDFNQSVPILPHSVIHIEFDDNFNQPIKGILPPFITYIEFGFNFNQTIDDCFPPTVTCLIFGESFNQPIINCIPHSVTHLMFGYDFNQVVEHNCIPRSVKHLGFRGEFNKSIPNGVTHLKLEGCAIVIPPSVIHLTLGGDFEFDDIDKNYIPSSVTHLSLNDPELKIFEYIPPSVTHLFIEIDHIQYERDIYVSLKNKLLPNIAHFSMYGI